MSKKTGRLLVLVAMAVLVMTAGSAMAASLSVTENAVYHSLEDYYELFFTVTNSGYTDIQEFAIGNNDAGSVWVDPKASSAPISLTKSGIAFRDKESGNWQVWQQNGGYRDLTWLDADSNFDSYTRAFLYTSWGYSDSDYSGSLDDGFTNGYWGDTRQFASPFAAYSASLGTITGETSAVPIPGALWLLGSGLFGLVAIRRRNNEI